MEKPFEFADETIWTDERIKERGQHLGKHILLAAEGTSRHAQMDHEINHIIFELSARAMAQTVTLMYN